MTDVDDLYEQGDEREPEPCEWYPAPEPVDLDAVEDTIRVYYAGSDDDSGKAAEEVVTMAARLVTDLRAARERIAAFEELPTREEWAVTAIGEPAPDPASGAWGGTADMAADYAAKHRGQAWRRMVHMRPGEPISPDAPF